MGAELESWPSTSRRVRVELDIINERTDQRRRYTSLQDDEKTPAEWVAEIAQNLGRAVTTEPAVYRKQLVVLGALAIAALEAHDRKYDLELE